MDYNIINIECDESIREGDPCPKQKGNENTTMYHKFN